jgi:protein involved in polysaccharide export with SLBB domain
MRLVLLLFLLATATALQAQDAGQANSGQQPPPKIGEIQAIGAESPYQLGPGDRISVSVFNQDDLSGDFPCR